LVDLKDNHIGDTRSAQRPPALPLLIAHPAAATVAGLYAGPLATTALHETLVAVARGLGDLPPLVRRAKTYEEMSADERARFNEANGFGRDLTEEEKRAMDEWATAGRSGVQAVRSARAR